MITEKQVKNDPDLLAWWTAIDSRTTKDKHDLLVAKLGNRINVIELATTVRLSEPGSLDNPWRAIR
jgi:hypothetical protein